MKRLITFVTIILAATTFGAMARDAVTGQYEYMNHCASCHGEGATGDGPLIEILKVPVPDLTVLSAENDGEFPFLSTLMVIDGRTSLRGHGNYMPVWGDTFEPAAVEKAGEYGAEMIVRGRLLSLVEYLMTVQQD